MEDSFDDVDMENLIEEAEKYYDNPKHGQKEELEPPEPEPEPEPEGEGAPEEELDLNAEPNWENVEEDEEADEEVLEGELIAQCIITAWLNEPEEERVKVSTREHYNKKLRKWLRHHSTRHTHPVERLGIEKECLMQYENMHSFYVDQVEGRWADMKKDLHKMGRDFLFNNAVENPKTKMARNGPFESFYLVLALSKDNLEHECTFPLLDRSIYGNPQHRRMFSNVTAQEAKYKDLTPLKENASIMHCIARYMEDNNYCVVDGEVWRYVPGTSYKVVELVMEYPDEMDGTNVTPMSINTFVRRAGMKIPEVQYFISMGVANPYGYCVDLITNGGSDMIKYPEKQWTYFAFSNCAIRVAAGPKRARSGQLRPNYECVKFEELPENVVCARYIEKEFSPVLFMVSMGFLQPKTREECEFEESIGTWTHLGGLGEFVGGVLVRRNGESPMHYMKRIRANFKVVDRTGERLKEWVHNEHTHYMTRMLSTYLDLKHEHEQQFEEGKAPEFYWPFTLDDPDIPSLIGRCTVLLRGMGMQKYSDQAMFTFFVCIGRSFYPARTLENWQCFTILMGASRSGKGTMLDVLYDFFGDNGVAQVKNDTKDLFSLGGINPNQRVLYFPDIRDFKTITREMILKMAAHENEVIRMMHTNPFNKRWMQKIYMATNVYHLLTKDDRHAVTTTEEKKEKEEKKVDVEEKKRKKTTPAMSARGVIFKHDEAIEFKAFDSTLDARRQEEVAQNFAICLRAISDMVNALGSTPLMANLPRSCYDSMMDVKAVEVLRGFLDDPDYVEMVPNEVTKMEHLKDAYIEFYRINSSARLTDEQFRRIHTTIHMRNSGFRNAMLERGFIVEGENVKNMKLRGRPRRRREKGEEEEEEEEEDE